MFQFAEELLQEKPIKIQFPDIHSLRRSYAKAILLASGKMTQFVVSTVSVKLLFSKVNVGKILHFCLATFSRVQVTLWAGQSYPDFTKQIYQEYPESGFHHTNPHCRASHMYVL